MRKNYEYSLVLKNNFELFKTTRIFVLNTLEYSTIKFYIIY